MRHIQPRLHDDNQSLHQHVGHISLVMSRHGQPRHDLIRYDPTETTCIVVTRPCESVELPQISKGGGKEIASRDLSHSDGKRTCRNMDDELAYPYNPCKRQPSRYNKA